MSPYTVVSDGAKSGNATSRIEDLSRPKTRESAKGIQDLGYFDKPLVDVSNEAANAKASSRVEELAHEKMFFKFVPERSIIWDVSDEAKHAVASQRLLQLARHKISQGDTEEYDPYVVTMAARRAKPAPRVVELSVPLDRKVVKKK